MELQVEGSPRGQQKAAHDDEENGEDAEGQGWPVGAWW